MLKVGISCTIIYLLIVNTQRFRSADVKKLIKYFIKAVVFLKYHTPYPILPFAINFFKPPYYLSPFIEKANVPCRIRSKRVLVFRFGD